LQPGHESIIVRGRVASVVAWWCIKDGPYNSQELHTQGQITFDAPGAPFKCDIVIDHPDEEIRQGGDDLAILGIVMRRIARRLDLAATDVMVQHMNDAGMHAMTGLKPRVDAGKARPKKEEEL
jgi:hypothetical protein